MRTSVILSMVLAACGSAGGGDDGGDGDGTDTSGVDAVRSPGEDRGGTQPVSGDCDISHTFRYDDNDSADYTEQVWFFSEFDLANADGISARLCNWSSNGSASNGYPPGGPACSAGYTCIGEGPPPPDCVIQEGGSIVDGKLRVSCGYEYSTLTTTSGGHWTSIEVTTH